MSFCFFFFILFLYTSKINIINNVKIANYVYGVYISNYQHNAKKTSHDTKFLSCISDKMSYMYVICMCFCKVLHYTTPCILFALTPVIQKKFIANTSKIFTIFKNFPVETKQSLNVTATA